MKKPLKMKDIREQLFVIAQAQVALGREVRKLANALHRQKRDNVIKPEFVAAALVKKGHEKGSV